MIRTWLSIIIFASTFTVSLAQKINNDLQIAFDQNANTTSTYQEVRSFYQQLDQSSALVQVTNFGMTDSGHPLQEVIIASDGHFTTELNQKAGKIILFINNGIHPGEPDGIDAMMLFAREISNEKSLKELLKFVTIVAIPVYNIGGCLNRTGLSRPNQNGPELYGFRGNAKNLDLNRDFIKCDSKNAFSFNQLFNKWKPNVFLDTHASNGSDYQHTFTLINTHKENLNPVLSQFMTQEFIPYIYTEMSKKGWDVVPYVMSNGTPDKGIYGFMDSPRYSSGFAALHHTISFMPETHMLKPYKDRVKSTLDFIRTTFQFMAANKQNLIKARETAILQTISQDTFILNYVLDNSQVDSISFQGYIANQKTSLVSGLPRLYYDRSQPWEANIPFYNYYKPDLKIKKPIAYIIPQAYDRIIELMKINNVTVSRLIKDTIVEVEMYKIESYETTKAPYEGHYLHYKTQVRAQKFNQQYYKGDYLIYTEQPSIQYIIQTLEPQAIDSWFSWNAFDGFLSQKEYYSDYVFEDIAADLLERHPELRVQLESLKMNDSDLAKNGGAQLDFVYKNSQYYEPEHMRYPVGRILIK